jgi:putative tricarboxylic transport membrane protein
VIDSLVRGGTPKWWHLRKARALAVVFIFTQETPMSISKRDFLALGAAAGASVALPAWAQGKPMFDTLNMFVPAAPGGGWDGTARAIERAAKAAGLVGNMAFENVGGAGGMVGLPRFVNQRKGQGNTLMVGGSVMIGAGIANKSPITIKNVTPIARLTEEAGVIVVPAAGKIKTWKELEAAIKANPKAVSVAGGSAGGTDHLILGMLIKALGKNPRLCRLCWWRPRQRGHFGQPGGGGHFGLFRV